MAAQVAQNPLDLSIIIVTHNSQNDIVKCLRSLEQFCLAVAYEIIVFDNASTDTTATSVAQQFPEVRLLRHATNAGFARANNLAAAQSRGRYLMLLNPDTWVDTDLAAAVVNFLNTHDEASACAPRILLPDGSLQIGSICALPRLRLLFFEQTGLSYLFPRSPIFGRYRMTHWNHADAREVEHATAACLVLRREAYLSVNGFDENFFMYIEDVDLSHRLKASGQKIFYLPTAHVYHAGGHSGSRQPVKNYLEQCRGFFLYYRKHHPRVKVAVAKAFFVCGTMMRILFLVPLATLEKILPSSHPYWKSRRQQLTGHVRALWHLWRF